MSSSVGFSEDGCWCSFYSTPLAPYVERNLSMKTKLNESGNMADTSDSDLLTHRDDVLGGKHQSLRANKPPLSFPVSAGLKGKDKLWLGTKVCCILSRWDNWSSPQIPFYCIPPSPRQNREVRTSSGGQKEKSDMKGVVLSRKAAFTSPVLSDFPSATSKKEGRVWLLRWSQNSFLCCFTSFNLLSFGGLAHWSFCSAPHQRIEASVWCACSHFSMWC